MENSIIEHLDLANVILTTIFGILFPALCVGAWKVSVRTRHLEVQHDIITRDLETLEQDYRALATIPGDFKRLDERCMVRCASDMDFRDRNDKAHERIERRQEQTDRRIEEAKVERRKELKELKDDLIREFRNSNGMKHA